MDEAPGPPFSLYEDERCLYEPSSCGQGRQDKPKCEGRLFWGRACFKEPEPLSKNTSWSEIITLQSTHHRHIFPDCNVARLLAYPGRCLADMAVGLIPELSIYDRF
jgi:hypothetical protein